MSWTYTLLRGGDDLDAKPFEPVSSGAVVLVGTATRGGAAVPPQPARLSETSLEDVVMKRGIDVGVEPLE